MKVRMAGLTKRWMLSVMSGILIVLILVEFMLILFARNYYFDSINQVLDAQTDTLESYFSSYQNVSDREFEQAATAFAETYEDKDRFEVQIFSSDGRIIVSTSGFVPEEGENVSDYQTAIGNPDGGYKGSYRGELTTGEKIMAMTVALGDSCRAVRMIVSLELAEGQITLLSAAALIVCAIFFSVTLFLGLFFIRSILTPVKKISTLAREIAQGNFSARIETSDRGEIGELCDSINYMAYELGTADKMKNDFLSSVSHELRTPLTAIRGWGETVREMPDDTATVENGIGVILGETERLSVLVEDLLDFSRMQNGRLNVTLVDCDLNAVVRETMLAFVKQAEANGLTVRFKERRLPTVQGDPFRLKQVVANIIDNAIKNTPSGGRIVISTKVRETNAEIVISDNGKGIPLEDLDKVKLKFYKSEKNKTVRGSGIGLAVADEIVRKHGGSLVINSVENIGTTVTIGIPVTRQGETNEGE